MPKILNEIDKILFSKKQNGLIADKCIKLHHLAYNKEKIIS